MRRLRPAARSQGGFYDYTPEPDLPSATVWHVNFADPRLFVAYGSSLFAQDEMQAAEHPALGALREALIARGAPAVTVQGGEPKPVLVMGVERRCRVATDPDPRAGRQLGFYGNRFAHAEPDVVRRATTPLDPPTISNVMAMAALTGGSGRYRAQQIEYLLRTAYTGFRAATLESKRYRGDPHPMVVHTGFWGCGAFGGNRTLMAILQILAWGMAALDCLVFTPPTPRGKQRSIPHGAGSRATLGFPRRWERRS